MSHPVGCTQCAWAIPLQRLALEEAVYLFRCCKANGIVVAEKLRADCLLFEPSVPVGLKGEKIAN